MSLFASKGKPALPPALPPSLPALENMKKCLPIISFSINSDHPSVPPSLPPSPGFEVGSGFEGTLLTGKTHNDEFYVDDQGREGGREGWREGGRERMK